jgi:nitric oxide reductase large subunit
VTYFNQNELNRIKFSFISIAITPALLLLVSIILWVFAKIIAGLMINKSASIDYIAKIDFKRFKLFVFSIVGLIILTQTIPSLVKMLFKIFVDIKKNAGLPYTITTFNLDLLIVDILKTLIGLALIIGPKRVSKWIKSTRTLGVDDKIEKRFDE